MHLILYLLWHPIPVFMHLNLIMCELFSIPFVFLYKPLETDFLFKKVALIDGIIVYLYFIMMCFCYFVHPPFSHLTAFIVRKKNQDSGPDERMWNLKEVYFRHIFYKQKDKC